MFNHKVSDTIFDDFPSREINSLWNDIRSGGFQDQKVYVVQTQTPVIERCIIMATDPG